MTGKHKPGNPRTQRRDDPVEIAKRFWSHVRQEGECWVWTLKPDSYGYGRIQIGGRSGSSVKAHRWAWEHMIGPIPDDLTLDHLCPNKMCVRPDHLEPVPSEENVSRHWKRQDTCKNGHVRTEENTYIRKRDGSKQCLDCSRARWAKNRDAGWRRPSRAR